MRAEMTVHHREGDLVGRLEQALGGHDAELPARSLTFANQQQLWPRIRFATETPNYRLLCWPNVPTEMQAFIEPVSGDFKGACDAIWRTVQAQAKDLDPSLLRLEIVDEVSGRTISSGTTALGAHFKRRETVNLLVVGVLGLALLVVGALTFAREWRAELAVGTAAAIVPGLLALLWVVVDVSRGRLLWQS